MYRNPKLKRIHEVKLRFSDQEESEITRLVNRTGAQPAVLLRELVMEALEALNDIEDTSTLEVAKEAR